MVVRYEKDGSIVPLNIYIGRFSGIHRMTPGKDTWELWFKRTPDGVHPTIWKASAGGWMHICKRQKSLGN